MEWLRRRGSYTSRSPISSCGDGFAFKRQRRLSGLGDESIACLMRLQLEQHQALEVGIRIVVDDPGWQLAAAAPDRLWVEAARDDDAAGSSQCRRTLRQQLLDDLEPCVAGESHMFKPAQE